MIATVNIGVLLEYSWPQGVLRCTGALVQVGHMSAATTTAVSKVKLARKAQVDDQMEVNSDKCGWSSDIEALHTQCPSAIQVSPMLFDTAASLEPLPAFR